jgi:glycerol-3-phosphate acyltransferase PlsY
MIEGFPEGSILLVAALVGYLTGATPFGLILTRLAGQGDIRAIGSGNIGATNVLRTGNKSLALATLLLDAAKGFVPAFVFASYGAGPALVAGIAAVLGHNFPVWLRFRGGKGVATSFGVIFAWSWAAGIVAAVAWIGVAAITRYSSAGALAALAAAPVAMAAFQGWAHAICMAGLSALGFIRHADNIRRLRSGEESRIGGGKPSEKTN